MRESSPKVEYLFTEITEKLNELTRWDLAKSEAQMEVMNWSERLSEMHKKLTHTQSELEEKMKAFDNLAFSPNDLQLEIKRLSDQLEAERGNNGKLGSDLAKSLELNLKLQFEIEEVRAKAQQILNEEKSHNQYLNDKSNKMRQELDLLDAVAKDSKLELSKAKDKIKELEGSLENFEKHIQSQQTMIENLTQVAEKKLVELKLALDKKSVESQDYYSHLQQALTQIQVLKQENTAMKDYISKLNQLTQQTTSPQISQSPIGNA